MEHNDANERIKARREELGLEVAEAAEMTDMSFSAYWDNELYENEPFEVTGLDDIKAICRALQLEPLPLFDIPCAFCEGGEEFREEYTLPRNELIRKARARKGLSPDQFGDLADYTNDAIQQMESDPDYLDHSSEVDRTLLVAQALDVPFQVLAGVQCGKCGR